MTDNNTTKVQQGIAQMKTIAEQEATDRATHPVATPSQPIPDTQLSFRPLFSDKPNTTLSLRVPNLQLHTVSTDYWRYFMTQVRCEIRLAFQANAVRIQVILPTGRRKKFYYRYETKLHFIVTQIMEFANYKGNK